MIKIEKTIYDPQDASDGKRILVMRIWPRGVAKSAIDLWLKELGTPKETIHDWKEGKITWAEFTKQYRAILNDQEALLRELAEEAQKETLTLLCSCKDAHHCHRALLKEAIESMHTRAPRGRSSAGEKEGLFRIPTGRRTRARR